MRFSVSEPDPAPYEPDPTIEAEAQRLEQWAIFVASLRDWAAHESWLEILEALPRVQSGFDFTGGDWPDGEIKQFSELHGWPDTLRAVAQAMQSDETAQREAFERR